MGKIYKIHITDKGDFKKPRGLRKAKVGDHILFVGQEHFTVIVESREPFDSDTFSEQNPCTGPLRVDLEGKKYPCSVLSPSKGPHPIIP